MWIRTVATLAIAYLALSAAAPAQERNNYVPEPRPAKTEYLVGAHYFPGWKEGTHFVPWPGEPGPWGWFKIVPYPNRTPLLGYYDEGSPEVADWEIKWALEHGISYFVYCWYRQGDNVGKPVTEQTLRLGHAIHEGLFRARYRDRFHFAIMWESNNGGGVSSVDDFMDNLVPFWVRNYFRNPSYLKIGNKPVLYIYHLGRLLEDFGGVDGVRSALARLRAAVAKEGFEGLVLLCQYGGTDPAVLAQIRDCGFDNMFAYAFHPREQRPTAQQAIEAQTSVLETWRKSNVLPFIPTATMGWDPLPWQHHNPNYSPTISRWMLAPEQFQSLLVKIKTMMDAMPPGSLGRRMLLLDNWNEWGEGHYLAPNAGAGFGYLKAVRETFTGRDNQPDYRSPHDLGLGPYDSRHQARWGGKRGPAPR